MTDMLEEIFELQAKLQVDKMGGHPAEMPIEGRIEFIKNMILALEDELHEAMAEVGWKPWATSRHINSVAYRSELVDGLHFFVNLCLADNMTPRELWEGYVAKNFKNHKRQEVGYDGVSTKCPGCKRDLKDAGVFCQDRGGDPRQIYCAQHSSVFLAGSLTIIDPEAL